MSRLAALLCLLLPAVSISAEPLLKAPPRFRVELLLQAPAIESPTALAVAANGDVYFAEDPMDMSGPPTKNLDRIWLLKGGDPKRKVLFADKLWAIMGMELVRDKLYVVHAPYVSVFTLDGQGKAKERKDLFTDLGPKVPGATGFNDHAPSGIRMGMDGWLYVSIGDKGIPRMTRKETDGGSVEVAEGRWRHRKEGHHISLEGGGVIRFRPDGSGLEVFASGTRNHLDVPLDEHDRIFVRDNTDDGLGWWTRLMYLPPGGFLGYPWAYTKHPKEALPMIRDFGGGSPCGGWVYLDDGLPETYRGRVFHCEWGKGQVFAVKLAPDGAGFKFVDEIAFLQPGDVKDFRPFTLRPTADGRGFYVTDWGYSGWMAKVKAGRLWKVTYTGDDVKPAPRGKDSDSTLQLIKSLDHPAHSERLRAQRALISRGDDAHWAAQKALRDPRSRTRARTHLLWTVYETRDRSHFSEVWLDRAYEAVEHQAPEVRLAAARVMSLYRPGDSSAGLGKIPRPDEYLVSLLSKDNNASARLAAAAGLSRQRCFVSSAKKVLAHLQHESDPYVRHLAIRALKETAQRTNSPDEGHAVWSWLNLEESFDEIAPTGKQPGIRAALIEVLQEEYHPAAARVLTRLAKTEDAALRGRAIEALSRTYFDRKPWSGGWWGTQPAGQKPPARTVAWEGTPLVRAALLHALTDRDGSVRKAAITGLLQANDPETVGPLVKQFDREKDSAARTDLVRALAGMKAPRAVSFLDGILRDHRQPEALRLEALAGLEQSKDAKAADSIARTAAASEPVALQVRALEALGILKASQARETCAASLESSEPAVRQAAASTLGKLGDSSAAKLLVPLLQDRESKVRVAAIGALGQLKARAAIPDLLQAMGQEATQFDAIRALTRIPDKRALTAYLAGLGSKNADLRKECRQALAAVRTEVLPDLETLVKRNEVRAEVLPELREIYTSHAPLLHWKLIGPFEEGKAHPPEKEVKLDASYKGAGKKVRWRDHAGDGSHHGKVNLAALFSPNNNVVAYGFTEVESARERDAELLLGSDDTMVVWLDGKKVFEFGGNRGWSYNQDHVKVHLHQGKNRLLIRCGNTGGPWEYSVALSGENERYAFLQGGKKYDLETFRAFGRKTPGDAVRGERLFRDVKGLACIKCHALNGDGGKVGPDLAGIGLRYGREDLMTSVLEPSKVIAQGYETIIIETSKGQTLTGVFKGETNDAVNLADADGKEHSVAKKDIEERSLSPVSTMPNGLSDGMTLQDFADLVAFLQARREDRVTPRK